MINIPKNGHKWTTAELKEIFKFPVIGYKKENGFLGLISKYNGKILFFTKSTDSGDYVNWFIGALCDNYNINLEEDDYCCSQCNYNNTYTKIYNWYVSDEIHNWYTYDKIADSNRKYVLNELNKILKEKLEPLIEEDYTYIFECIDPINDPHIIKYESSKVVLLDVVKNSLEEDNFKSYEELIRISNILCVPVKQKELEFNTWEEFEKWKVEFTTGITQWDCKHEGYVLVDQNNFRVKFKSSFYQFWKNMRGLKERLQKGSENKKIYKTKEEIQVVKLLESIPKEELKNMSIIDIENRFYENYGG